MTEAATQAKRRGRPPKADADKLGDALLLRLTQAQREKLQRLGGQQWLRDRIDAARER